MSIERTPPPAGWYVTPGDSATLTWWDGAQWTDQHHPAAAPVVTKVPGKVAATTQALLIAIGVITLASIVLEAFGLSAASRFLGGDSAALADLEAYDQFTFPVSIFWLVVYLATGVLWAVWQYRVAAQVRGSIRRAAGWHAGAWFVPVVSLWFPYQNITDLWRAVGRTRPGWQVVWWALWIAGNALSQVSARILLSAEDLDLYRIGMAVGLAADVVILANVPLAVLIVRGITRGLRERSTALG